MKKPYRVRHRNEKLVGSGAIESPSCCHLFPPLVIQLSGSTAGLEAGGVEGGHWYFLHLFTLSFPKFALDVGTGPAHISGPNKEN